MTEAQAKRLFLVSYQIEQTDKPWNMRITTEDEKMLHQILVNITNKSKPIADWYDLVVHETVGEDTKSFGKYLLGGMFDHLYEFKSEGAQPQAQDKEEEVSWFIKGRAQAKRPLVLEVKDSVFTAPFMCY